jgi:hypothetical protein
MTAVVCADVLRIWAMTLSAPSEVMTPGRRPSLNGQKISTSMAYDPAGVVFTAVLSSGPLNSRRCEKNW